MGNEEGKKPISIRGIDRRLYEEMSVLAKQAGRTIGELLNEAMELFISFREGVREVSNKFIEGLEKSKSTVISNINTLTINANDLKEAEGMIIFKDIDRLEFDNDVSQELFNDKVRRIIKVNKLIIPKNLSKIKVLTKCLFVSSIEIKE